jgi:hypothetical protein
MSKGHVKDGTSWEMAYVRKVLIVASREKEQVKQEKSMIGTSQYDTAPYCAN